MNRLATLVLLGALVATGCNEPKSISTPAGNPKADSPKGEVSKDDKEAAVIKAALAKLSPEDRALAEAQKLCPETDELLGSMGTPLKVMVKDQVVFLCCKSCEKPALKDPDKTLAKVKELKEKNSSKK
jgi:hypothetical protein